ncbi:glycosyltransferase [Anaeromyxobacter oryzae]|uniref:Glycosyl transferase family 1 n=1 Tax=Anaeromyxobacter oryzae TaxID=2918170 RepID=A0ABN6MWP7_9BACT|nr:glycosyltransferase [Anaeromyxobacter oryzae]BDG04143.1 glycosyl transferase family 1 [Anaeromyxobacter oryzae]
MNVLHVSYALAPAGPGAPGGAEQVLGLVDRGLVRRGHGSTVVAPAGSRAAARVVPSAPVPERIDGPARERQRLAHRAAIARAVAADRYDVVHAHGLDFGETLPDDRPVTVATLHLPPQWYPARALRRGDVALVCVSETQAAAMPPGAPLTAVVPNGVDLDLFRPAPAREGFVLVLARICPEKGIHLALDAARRAGLPLVLAGAVFPYEAHQRYFEEEVRPRLDRERRFVGAVGPDQKARLLAAARCLVAASLAPETSSLVAMEALASGTPVVARPAGALPEIVEDGRTGLLADGVEALAEAIRGAGRLRAADCRRAAERRFDARRMVVRYLDVYARVRRRARERSARVAPARSA